MAGRRARHLVRTQGRPSDRRRNALHKAIELSNYQFNAHGIELGYHYRSDVIVDDGSPDPTPARDPQLYYQPTTRPGARVPHARLERDGVPVSSLDLVDDLGFALLTGVGGESWSGPAAEASARAGMPVRVHVIGGRDGVTDPYGEWASLREVETTGCVLVRPDRHVAWRSHALHPGPSAAASSPPSSGGRSDSPAGVVHGTVEPVARDWPGKAAGQVVAPTCCRQERASARASRSWCSSGRCSPSWLAAPRRDWSSTAPCGCWPARRHRGPHRTVFTTEQSSLREVPYAGRVSGAGVRRLDRRATALHLPAASAGAATVRKTLTRGGRRGPVFRHAVRAVTRDSQRSRAVGRGTGSVSRCRRSGARAQSGAMDKGNASSQQPRSQGPGQLSNCCRDGSWSPSRHCTAAGRAHRLRRASPRVRRADAPRPGSDALLPGDPRYRHRRRLVGATAPRRANGPSGHRKAAGCAAGRDGNSRPAGPGDRADAARPSLLGRRRGSLDYPGGRQWHEPGHPGRHRAGPRAHRALRARAGRHAAVGLLDDSSTPVRSGRPRPSPTGFLHVLLTQPARRGRNHPRRCPEALPMGSGRSWIVALQEQPALRAGSPMPTRAWTPISSPPSGESPGSSDDLSPSWRTV